MLLDWLYNFEDSVETAAIRHERDTKSGMHKVRVPVFKHNPPFRYLLGQVRHNTYCIKCQT